MGDGVVPGWVIRNRDCVFLLLPVGVPCLGVFVVPLLLEDDGAVGSEFDDEDTMYLCGNTAAAGVKSLELLRGVGGGREDGAKQDERGD